MSSLARWKRVGLTLLCLGTACAGGGGRATGKFVPSASPTAPAPDPAPPPRADGRLPAGVTPERYRLELTLDPRQPTFMGRVRIEVQLAAPTRVVVLHARGPRILTAAITAGGVKQWAEARGRPAAHSVSGESEELVLVVPAKLSAGSAEIDLQYEAPFADGLRGIYRVTEAGKHFAFSQMEPNDARRALPCFDEPGFKTPFEVSISVPSGDLAVANAPERSRRESEAAGLTSFEFEPTPPLPTYLLAVASGPLVLTPGQGGTTPLRAVTVPGKEVLTARALEVAARQLSVLERYFDQRYAFTKLDLAAVPEFGAGAMENPGLVTFREELLLLDAGASVDARRGLSGVMAHELAHQWFGNAVTMRWWDDLWLNEGLATWMGGKVVGETEPQWGAELERVTRKRAVMAVDSLSTARRVREPVKSSSEALAAFDGVTYVKGASVIEMVEHWVGEVTFRAGVRGYVAEHLHGNATAADLFRHVDAVAKRPASEVLASFVDQTGVPVIRAELDCGGRAPGARGAAKLRLSQREWRPLGAAPTGQKRWKVPVCIRVEAGRSSRASCHLSQDTTTDVELAGERCPKWVVVNAHESGYYLSELPPTDLRRLVALGPKGANERERVGLVGSIASLIESGDLGADEALHVFDAFERESSRVVWLQLVEVLKRLHDAVVSDADRPALERRIARLTNHAWRTLGTAAKSGEDEATRLHRTTLWTARVDLAGDDAARAEAVRLADEWLDDPTRVGADRARTVVPLAARAADDAWFARAVSRYRTATTPEQRLIALSGMTGADRTELVDRTLSLALDGTIKAQDLRYVFRALAERRAPRVATYRWLVANFGALKKRVPSFVLGRLPWVVAGLCDAAEVEQATRFFGPRLAQLEGAEKHLKQAAESGHRCAALVLGQQPRLARALQTP